MVPGQCDPTPSRATLLIIWHEEWEISLWAWTVRVSYPGGRKIVSPHLSRPIPRLTQTPVQYLIYNTPTNALLYCNSLKSLH